MLDETRRQCHNDPMFGALVQTMVSMLEQSQITTHDLGRAAVLAAQMHAERNCVPLTESDDEATE